MSTIVFPERCLTLLPPWPQAIAYAGKRLENRCQYVAAQVANFRGIVGLSQSKAFTESIKEDVVDISRDIKYNRELKLGDVGAMAGKLWLAAELMDVLPPHRCEGADWHVSGQWGLILGRAWEVEPVACMGGQGAWRPQWCPACAKVIADSHGSVCKACRTTLHTNPIAPPLRVVREL